MGALPDGSYVYLLYGGAALWHERIVLAWVTGSTYVVLSPDADLFLEKVDVSNDDLDGLRIGAPGGGLPYGLRGQSIYAFAPRPSGADLAGLLDEGRRLAKAERQARGLVGVSAAGEPVVGAAFAPVVVPRRGAGPAPAVVSGSSVEGTVTVPASTAEGVSQPGGNTAGVFGVGERVAPEGGLWVLDEPAGGFPVGSEVEGVSGVIDFGGRAFVRVGDELATIRYIAEGGDVGEFVRGRLAVLLATDSRVCRKPGPSEVVPLDVAERAMKADEGNAKPLKGPRTLEESMRGIIQRGAGGFMGAHDRWIVESRIDPTSRSAIEHKVVSKSLHLAMC